MIMRMPTRTSSGADCMTRNALEPSVPLGTRVMRLAVPLSILLALLGVIRIISTYHVFNQTTDEPAHIACGMEWLQRGTYRFETITPPLARIATAVGPFLAGIRLTNDNRSMWDQGNGILATHGNYIRNLSLARAGILPFFLLGAFVVWCWAKKVYGHRAALLAVFFYTTCPVILGHAGLATTDMALEACCSGALLALILWLEYPTYSLSVILGAAIGLAILSKFSALVFLLSCGLLFFGAKLLSAKDTEKPRLAWYKVSGIAVLTLFLVLWAGYRFSMGPIASSGRSHAEIDHFVKTKGILHDVTYSIVESRLVPMPAFWSGIQEVFEYNTYGHKAYLLGKIRQDGWWYFFPVALGVKTPIPLLILAVAGMFYLARLSLRKRDWMLAAPVLAFLGLLAVGIHSRLDLGVRYVLPIYSMFAVTAGVAADRLLKVKARYIGLALVLVLLMWESISTSLAHPDYMAYFNEFAGRHPENILIDSDLDWGQDMVRLSRVLHQNGVKEFSIVYSGTADLRNFDLPPYHTLSPYERATGWIAISMFPLKTGDLRRPNDSFQWLEAYRPFCTVGPSMLLYHLENQQVPSTRSE